MCEHKRFISKVNVTRLTESEGSTDVTGYRADFFVSCEECGQSFKFIGVPQGYNNSHPTTNFNGTELRCPIGPSIEKPDESLKKAIQN